MVQDGSSGSGMGSMDWIELAQDRDRRRALVNAVMKLRDPQNSGNFTDCKAVSLSRRTLIHGVSKLVTKNKVITMRKDTTSITCPSISSSPSPCTSESSYDRPTRQNLKCSGTLRRVDAQTFSCSFKASWCFLLQGQAVLRVSP